MQKIKSWRTNDFGSIRILIQTVKSRISNAISLVMATSALGICFLIPTQALSAIDEQAVVVNFDTWTTHGPEGGQIGALAIDPDNPEIVYAASRLSGGVYKSTDGGLNWANIGYSADTDWSIVGDLAIDPNNSSNIYVATSRGIFKSTNGGISWSAMNQGFTDLNTSILRLRTKCMPVLLTAFT